jgi:hypothetical protein
MGPAIFISVESVKQNTLFLICACSDDCDWETKTGGESMNAAKANAEAVALDHIRKVHPGIGVTVVFE